MAMGDRGSQMKKSTAMTGNNMASSSMSTTRKEFTTIMQPPTSVTQQIVYKTEKTVKMIYGDDLF